MYKPICWSACTALYTLTYAYTLELCNTPLYSRFGKPILRHPNLYFSLHRFVITIRQWHARMLQTVVERICRKCRWLTGQLVSWHYAMVAVSPPPRCRDVDGFETDLSDQSECSASFPASFDVFWQKFLPFLTRSYWNECQVLQARNLRCTLNLLAQSLGNGKFQYWFVYSAHNINIFAWDAFICGWSHSTSLRRFVSLLEIKITHVCK